MKIPKVMRGARFFKKCYSIFKISTLKNSTWNLTVENMNQNIIEMEYAVRGAVAKRADEIEKELASGKKKPFYKVVKANLGDCHAMGQKPITFFRQVLALISYPQLLNCDHFPPDAKTRALNLLNACRGKSAGSYTDSFGIEMIRKHVAEFIENRDGFTCEWQNIFLSNGASEAITHVLKLLNQEEHGKPPGVMTPIPQYPLYSAKLTELGMKFIGYYLNEKENWSLDIEELNRSIEEAKSYCNPRAIVIINPGNPTGQVLTRENIEMVVKFAYENKLILFADEVYQFNVYAEGSMFHSFKKVINEMGDPYCTMELASFYSCSKGFMGECGIRGGYCELINVHPEVKVNFAKSISSMLCPGTIGQCLMDCVVKPPAEGEPSYELFQTEVKNVFESLKLRATIVHEFFNSVEGFSCNEVEGAMYAFPKIHIPEKAVQVAKSKNMDPNTFYVFELLEHTGICVIAGSGFKQEPGTYHFRTTILPPVEVLEEMFTAIREFQETFLKTYC